MSVVDLNALADRVDALHGYSNDVDVLIDVVMFEPDSMFTAIRANAAGTKVICTRHDGREKTFWASDWTISPERRSSIAAELRARASQETERG